MDCGTTNSRSIDSSQTRWRQCIFVGGSPTSYRLCCWIQCGIMSWLCCLNQEPQLIYRPLPACSSTLQFSLLVDLDLDPPLDLSTTSKRIFHDQHLTPTSLFPINTFPERSNLSIIDSCNNPTLYQRQLVLIYLVEDQPDEVCYCTQVPIKILCPLLRYYDSSFQGGTVRSTVTALP